MTTKQFYSDFDGDGFDDPMNPNRTPNTPLPPRDMNVGAWVYHLPDDEMHELHDKVHDEVLDWGNTLEWRDNTIDDTMRMATHCLANKLSDGFMNMSGGVANESAVYHLIRTAIQIGYLLKQDEDNGELRL